MIKFLHSADWHLDASFSGRTPEEKAYLRSQSLLVPGRIVRLAKEQGCQMLVLSGDLFDGAYTQESLQAVRVALEEAAMPVFISPGNHDYAGAASPWLRETWPENVHIFTKNTMETVYLEELGCYIYGAGFESMDCPALLQGFKARQEGLWHIGILHGDPLVANSPYCPVSAPQVRNSGLDYLALGHIHKEGRLRQGNTLCAWPGCPMGQGFDELGPKGVLLVTLDAKAQAEFVPLDTPRFHVLQVNAGLNPLAALENILPAGESRDFYRIRLTGECEKPDTAALTQALGRLPHLYLVDETVPVLDLWGSTGDDSLEGVFFRLLHEELNTQPEEAKLAARICRLILQGQEVVLP